MWLSCLVYWLCSGLAGGIAFGLSSKLHHHKLKCNLKQIRSSFSEIDVCSDNNTVLPVCLFGINTPVVNVTEPCSLMINAKGPSQRYMKYILKILQNGEKTKKSRSKILPFQPTPELIHHLIAGRKLLDHYIPMLY